MISISDSPGRTVLFAAPKSVSVVVSMVKSLPQSAIIYTKSSVGCATIPNGLQDCPTRGKGIVSRTVSVAVSILDTVPKLPV